jgi:cytochrome b pre-mRNA-processing protein 3
MPIKGFLMIFGLFGKKNNNKAIIARQYALLTAAARQPDFYLDMHVPDTVMGRFEMLTVVMILYFRRTAHSGVSGQEIAQEIIDAFFEDIDHSIRELGIGDVSVPKKVKRFARMYYGRLESYAAALDADDTDALAEALRRNIRPEEPEAPQMQSLAHYMIKAEQDMKTLDEEIVASGNVQLPSLQSCQNMTGE